MTLRELYRLVLTYLNKTGAPSLLLSDFNFLVNKAIILYCNKKYTLYETTLLLTDDLRVLSVREFLEKSESGINSLGSSKIFTLPKDYFHILSCTCKYNLSENTLPCLNQLIDIIYPAKKATSDILPLVINNYYYKPQFDRPYFSIKLNLIEINCGDTDNLNGVFIEYLRTPEIVKLTKALINTITDGSKTLEFLEYTCHEIINELINLILENNSNPRLQTYSVVTQSIANPQLEQK